MPSLVKCNQSSQPPTKNYDIVSSTLLLATEKLDHSCISCSSKLVGWNGKCNHCIKAEKAGRDFLFPFSIPKMHSFSTAKL